jgi:hypothetical protein
MIAITIATGMNGYTAGQVVENAISVDDLITYLKEMARDYGSDTPVVVRMSGNGAVYEPVLSVETEEDEDM